jgi:ZIP family zinc transporter
VITLAAGLATTFGAALVFIVKPEDDKKFSVFLALSAGVMVFLCFSEMIPEAIECFEQHLRDGSNNLSDSQIEKRAQNYATLWFFAATLLCAIVDKGGEWLVKEKAKRRNEELATPSCVEEGMEDKQQADSIKNDVTPKSPTTNLVTMAIFSAIALTIHNFPEGVSTFIANAKQNSFGPAMAIAIGLHNIPEGVAVALPVLKATGSKWRAFTLATLSGVAQPVAAIFAWLIIRDKLSPIVEACIYSFIAGINFH